MEGEVERQAEFKFHSFYWLFSKPALFLATIPVKENAERCSLLLWSVLFMVGKTGNTTATTGCDELRERRSFGFGQGWGLVQKKDTTSAWSGLKKEQCQKSFPREGAHLSWILRDGRGGGGFQTESRKWEGREATVSHVGFMSRGNVLLNTRVSQNLFLGYGRFSMMN